MYRSIQHAINGIIRSFKQIFLLQAYLQQNCRLLIYIITLNTEATLTDNKMHVIEHLLFGRCFKIPEKTSYSYL